MSWIYDNIELCGGIFFGFLLTSIFFFITQIVTWRLNHTNFVIVDELKGGTLVGQCMHCHKDFIMNNNVRFCPGCGREIEKIIDADITWMEVK